MNIYVDEIPDDLHKRFKILCVLDDITLNQKIIGLMEKEVNLRNIQLQEGERNENTNRGREANTV